MDAEKNKRKILFEAINSTIEKWQQEGIPPRWTLIEELKKLSNLRKSLGIPSILPYPFRILTTTLDDGWGLGLDIIHHACDVFGIDYTFLGFLKSPEEIIEACSREMPNALGVTVIQEESLDSLLEIRRMLPDYVEVFAGGPGLQELPTCKGITVLKNVLEFILLFREFRERA